MDAGTGEGVQTRQVKVWENQRKPVLRGEATDADHGFSSETLLPTERPQWSDSEGTPRTKQDCPLAPGWKWASEWSISVEEGVTDKDGWQYAWAWHRTLLGSPISWECAPSSSFGAKSWVRRRLHYRTAQHTPSGFTTTNAIEEAMPLLPSKVSVEYLETHGGGPEKCGWLWKEGTVRANWQKRWFVLWPKASDPEHGRILAYFKERDSRSAQGVLQVNNTFVRKPKVGHDDARFSCARVHTHVITGPSESSLEVSEKKLLLGAQSADDMAAWKIAIMSSSRMGLSNPLGSLATPLVSGHLLKRNPQGLAWWKLRYFELHGNDLCYWDSEQSEQAGSFKLNLYSIYFPSFDTGEAHRQYEMVLIPKASGHGDYRYLAVDDNATEFAMWRKELEKAMPAIGKAQGDIVKANISAELAERARDPEMGGMSVFNRGGAATASTPRPSIGLLDFDLVTVLGRGGFGKVLLARKKDTRVLYAMKILSKQYIIQKKETDHIKVERDILKDVRHPFMVGLHYAFHTPTRLYLIVDYVSGGELYFHLQRQRKFDEKQTCFIVAELALALAHLHSLDVLYRDLKPENVLIEEDGHVKLTDFGLAKAHMTQTLEEKAQQTFCGTPLYLAPEAISSQRNKAAGQRYTFTLDWWTFGALVFEMVTGQPPFKANSLHALMREIETKPVIVPASIEASCVNLIQAMLCKDPKRRLGNGGIGEIQLHKFFESIDWEKLARKELKPVFVPPKTKKIAGHFDSRYTAMSTHEKETSAAVPADRDPFKDFGFEGMEDEADAPPEPAGV